MEKIGQTWNYIINSSSIVNSATVLSLVLALIFFTYQEYRKRQEKNKEIIRLNDEIVNLIIRNHVNNSVPISQINFAHLINGLEILKDCKLNYEVENLLKMVYAKVYENEHISKEIRINILIELENLLGGYQFELNNDKRSESTNKTYLFTAFLSSSLIILLDIGVIFLISQGTAFFKDSKYIGYIQTVSTLLLIVLLIGLVWSKPVLEKILDSIFELFSAALFGQKVKEIHKDSVSNKEKPQVINLIATDKEVKFDDIFEEKESMIEIFQQRAILEHLLRKFYLIVFNEESKLPIVRIVNLLEKDFFKDDFSYQLKKFYTLSSVVIHTGKIPPEISYTELIRGLKSLAAQIQTLLSNIQQKEAT